MNLGAVDGFDEIKKEIIEYVQNIELNAINTSHPTDKRFLNLDVVGLYDYHGRSDIAHRTITSIEETTGGAEFHKDEITTATEHIQYLPNTDKMLNGLFDNKGRTRISILRPHKSVGWHTHFYPNYNELVLHIPIQTSSGVKAQVGSCPFSRLKRREDWFTKPPHYEETSFSEGYLWLFNGQQYHSFSNTTDTDRIHIWITTCLLDPDGKPINEKIRDLIEKAIHTYDGPYV